MTWGMEVQPHTLYTLELVGGNVQFDFLLLYVWGRSPGYSLDGRLVGGTSSLNVALERKVLDCAGNKIVLTHLIGSLLYPPSYLHYM